MKKQRNKPSETQEKFAGFKSPNFTQAPNEFFDVLLGEISEMCELKVTLAVIRNTFGWQRDTAELSLSFLEQATGMDRRRVKRGLAMAMKRGTVQKVVAQTNKRGATYRMNVEAGSELAAKMESQPAATPPSRHVSRGTAIPPSRGTATTPSRPRLEVPPQPPNKEMGDKQQTKRAKRDAAAVSSLREETPQPGSPVPSKSAVESGASPPEEERVRKMRARFGKLGVDLDSDRLRRFCAVTDDVLKQWWVFLKSDRAERYENPAGLMLAMLLGGKGRTGNPRAHPPTYSQAAKHKPKQTARVRVNPDGSWN